MKKTQEFTGKDVDAAVAKACSVLAISKEKLDYKVITAGASGIFGIVGRKDAKIKVTLSQKETAKTSDEELEGIRSIVDEAFGEETRVGAPPIQEAIMDPEPAADEDIQPEQDIQPEENIEPDEDIEPEEDAHGEIDEDADADTEGNDDGDMEDLDNGDDDWDAEPQAEGPPPVDVTQESIDLGKEALQKMADLITENATVEAQTEQDRLTLKITGGNSGILIGRKGQTLDAMQFLIDKIINRKSEARVRVKVDIEGYMETRKINLKHLAQKMAEKAKKTGRPTTINQMSAQDRRIVHLALKDDSRVRTQSMGDGYYRRLVIFPKTKNSFRGKRRLKK